MGAVLPVLQPGLRPGLHADVLRDMHAMSALVLLPAGRSAFMQTIRQVEA